MQNVTIRRLARGDVGLMHGMLTMFGKAFDDAPSYASNRPDAAYVDRLLESDNFIALAALKDDVVIGGLAAYELKKFEQPRSEIYIYDLAVDEMFRREGIATGLIEELKRIAIERGAYVIYVQADLGDDPAIGLYTKMGTREDVLHFDIPVK